MKELIFIMLIFFTHSLSAATPFENSFTLRGGLSFNLIEMETDRLIDNHESDPGELEDETKTIGYGFVTNVGYRFSDWEFTMNSDVTFGLIKDMTFIYEQNSIRGKGFFRLISIGPQIKYYTPYTLSKYANIYIGAGPAWSLQTFVFRDPTTTGNFNDKKRISFESYGGGLFIGLEEIVPGKENHPLFLEVGYSYMHSYKVSILDASSTTDVVTLSEGDSNDFSAHYIIIRAGMTFF